MFTLPLLQLGLMHVLGTGPFLDPTAIRDPSVDRDTPEPKYEGVVYISKVPMLVQEVEVYSHVYTFPQAVPELYVQLALLY